MNNAALGLALLDELLVAFGVNEARRLQAAPSSPRLPGSSSSSAREAPRSSPSLRRAPDLGRHEAELAAALPALVEVVNVLRELRAPALARPEAYGETWAFIVDEWNQAVRDHAWVTLPPLCEGCGLPVLAREGEAFACSDACRTAGRASRAKAKRKKRTA